MPKRADRNQSQIVRDLRRAGFSVQSLHTVGDGCPDILVGHQGMNWLFEIKNPEQPPSKRKLSPDEEDWHKEWSGQVDIIHSAVEVLKVILPVIEFPQITQEDIDRAVSNIEKHSIKVTRK